MNGYLDANNGGGGTQIEFEGIPYQMSPELIDRAWANMFVKEEHIEH